MSADREVTRIVRSWLDEDVTVLPDRVMDAVLDQVHATRQRRAWWPTRRLHTMKASISVVAVAAAVLVLAVIGVGLAARPGGVAGPAPTPTAIPTPAPTLPLGDIPPGRYRSGSITYTLPAGWSTPEGGSSTIFKVDSDPPKGMAIDYQWAGGIPFVYGDPCHSTTTGNAVSANVDSLVAAFVAQKRSATVTPVDITIDGFTGKEIDLVVPLDVAFAAPSSAPLCDGGQHLAWATGPAVAGGTRGPASTTCSTSSMSTARRP